MTTAYLRVIKGKVRLEGRGEKRAIFYNEFDVSSIDGGAAERWQAQTSLEIPGEYLLDIKWTFPL